jgi:hypothetical protein
MDDWGHEGHVGPRKTDYTSLARVQVDNGVLVAPRGPKGVEMAVFRQSLGPRHGPWGHVLRLFSPWNGEDWRKWQ